MKAYDLINEAHVRDCACHPYTLNLYGECGFGALRNRGDKHYCLAAKNLHPIVDTDCLRLRGKLRALLPEEK